METQTIFADVLSQNLVDPQTQREVMEWYKTITKQTTSPTVTTF
jgi:hypothetical protein